MLLKYIPGINPNPDDIDSILPTVSLLTLHDSTKEGKTFYIISRNKRCQILQKPGVVFASDALYEIDTVGLEVLVCPFEYEVTFVTECTLLVC